MVKVGKIEKDVLLDVSDVVHEMPPFLARNLEGFRDDWFWEKASNRNVFPLLTNWFEMGIVLNSMRENFIEELKKAED